MDRSKQSNSEVPNFYNEIHKIASFYGIPFGQIENSISFIAKDFLQYWEMVFSDTEFELITANKGMEFIQRVCNTASNNGLKQSTIDLFLTGARAFPDAITGIKLCFSKNQNLKPTLYVRTKSEKSLVFQFLADHFNHTNVDKLKSTLAKNKVFYGIGFSEKEDELYLKTYTIDDIINSKGEKAPGFVSHRLFQNEISKEHKEYLPEVPLTKWETDMLPLKSVIKFLTYKMNYTTAGHIGMLYTNDLVKSYKVYVERIGGIPTDFNAQ